MKGSTLNEVIIHSGRYSRHGNPPGLDEASVNFPLTIEEVDFHGKLIMFTLKDSKGSSWWIWNTLGMSGGWRMKKEKHSHVEFVTSNGSFFFTDVRNFGTLRFTNNQKATESKIRSIGPNHLHDEISDNLFEERLMKFPNSDVCQALMNQSLIGGIGNYIKAEVLYRSRISPYRKVKDITKEEFSRLNRSTREVILSSFENRGASIRTYHDVDGESGNFPFFFHVYDRKTCLEGFTVVRETTSDGRTTHWVPQLQS
jgi:formamidopyrimidine-DNA glycosylase